VIVLDSQTIDLSDLFGENNGLHDVDDKEEGIARSMTMARSSFRASAKTLQTAVWSCSSPKLLQDSVRPRTTFSIRFALPSYRLDLKYPQTAVCGIRRVVSSRVCRLNLKYPQTAVCGILQEPLKLSETERQKSRSRDRLPPSLACRCTNCSSFQDTQVKELMNKAFQKKSEKIFYFVFAGVFALYREIRARRSPRPITRLASPTPKAAVTPK